MTASRISIINIPESLDPGDMLECTVDDEPHDAEFIRYGADTRCIFVRIYGLYEASSGKVIAPPMFPEAHTFVTEFVVNDAPGTSWHRTAGLILEVGG